MVQVILTQCITLDTQTMTGIYVMLARAGVLCSGTALLFLQAAETLQMECGTGTPCPGSARARQALLNGGLAPQPSLENSNDEHCGKHCFCIQVLLKWWPSKQHSNFPILLTKAIYCHEYQHISHYSKLIQNYIFSKQSDIFTFFLPIATKKKRERKI